MKYIIPPVLCLVVGFTLGWYLVYSHLKAELDATMLHVVVMGVPSGDGKEHTYTESGLRRLAVQYLHDHHVTVHGDGIGLVVHMKPMDVDSHPVFATVMFFEGTQANPGHAVDIGADGTVIRDYAIERAKAN